MHNPVLERLMAFNVSAASFGRSKVPTKNDSRSNSRKFGGLAKSRWTNAKRYIIMQKEMSGQTLFARNLVDIIDLVFFTFLSFFIIYYTLHNYILFFIIYYFVNLKNFKYPNM